MWKEDMRKQLKVKKEALVEGTRKQIINQDTTIINNTYT